MTEKQIIHTFATTVGVRISQVQAALQLLQDGNTIPFIARYRKEATGMLDEVQLRRIQECYTYEQTLNDRRETVRQSITEQGLWTTALAKQLEAATHLQEIEDIYLPYKPKKRTKASMARDAGLEPLADMFWQQRGSSYHRRCHQRRRKHSCRTHFRANCISPISSPRPLEIG